MNNALFTCESRIVAALEYLAHEPDPIRSITLAETQLRQALISLSAARGDSLLRRSDDTPPSLTFGAAERVPRNPWPPADQLTKASAKEFCRVFGEQLP